MRSPFPPFAWRTLRCAPSEREREALASAVRTMLRFQRTLTKWKLPDAAPDATPFVGLYADGHLRGCYASDEGTPGERLARAFLRALDDGRFGGVRANERDRVVAQVSYVRRAKLVNPATAAEELELGVHGVAVVPEKAATVLLLPHVARDGRIGPVELLQTLSRKAGLGDDGLGEHAVYLLETEDVVVRVEPGTPTSKGLDAARAWLASLVTPDGRVTFAIDPRARTRSEVGVMHHGRASVVAHALGDGDASAAHQSIAGRVRARLLAEARAALGGSSVEGWPQDAAQVAGTLALMLRAGIPLRRELGAFLAVHDVARSPWHSAQVVAALGVDAPEALWRSCVSDLDAHPWAPWTVLAADARGDLRVRERAARALVAGLRTQAPYRGAGTITAIPEVALTALAVEALSRHPAPWARAAVTHARSFIARTQLVGDRVYGALDPWTSWGAFPTSPVVDWLRCDVTAHAVLALGTRQRSRARASRAKP
jgi:AMMECR1 domain-containing protein